ncbi:GNAT family N-acetyltransferase [Flavobacterium humi]|uniref:GNAT family N-acetyltransferase n=1 Tax=Flavobacterium humi TaxID=2562683 RepID=A0A4Z0L5Z5_9FLAO|nr:GNAT family N-acetyltransferase [Flavobacterium humi]TGD57688.1 GNAT family N-acetyltransferase [Flavobacterium humi]
MKLIRTTSDNIDFQYLTALFDEYLVIIDGDEKDFFAQFNKIELKNVVVCYDDGIAVGCGAFKEYEPQVAEIKRMFVHPEHRGKGVASKVLAELESWAKELGFGKCILETSYKLENAILLYKKSGYATIENYGQYIGVESSICMEKII